MDSLVYCSNRKCERDDCIRKDCYMPFNEVCKRATFDCNKGNKYKHFLGNDDTREDTIVEQEEINEEEYISFLNKVANENDTWFYIEPFVGNTESIDKIEGKFTKYGTDIDTDKIKDLKERYKENEKNFKAGGYKSWDKVLLEDKYAGHCVVYCEPPYLNKTDEFDMKEFLIVVESWSHKNRVFVRMPQKAKNWELICAITTASNLYEVKPK